MFPLIKASDGRTLVCIACGDILPHPQEKGNWGDWTCSNCGKAYCQDCGAPLDENDECPEYHALVNF